jgi:hypothetical protein
MRSTLTKLSISAALALAISACAITTGTVDADAGATTADAGATTADAGKDATTDGATSDAGGDGGACLLKISTTQGASCDKCLETTCCTEVNACLTSADCIALITCVTGCDARDAADPADAGSEQSACLQDCSTAHSASVNAYVDYSACVVPACQTGAEAPCR